MNLQKTIIRVSATLASVEQILSQASDLIAQPIDFEGPAEQSDRERRDRRTRIVDIAWQVSVLAARVTQRDTLFVTGLDDIHRMAVGIATDNYGEAVLGLLGFQRIATLGPKLPQSPILIFLTDIAQARQPSDVQRLLQDYAAPPGSYIVKRTDGASFFGLNSYLGLGAGCESVAGVSKVLHGCPLSAGIALPIGFEVTLGHHRGRSYGLFLQFLDLGALASYRLGSSDSLEQAPKVGFKELYSPGAYLVIGFSGIPLSLGLGYSVTPDLRTLKSNGTSRAAHHLPSMFVGMDVPLFAVTRRAAPK